MEAFPDSPHATDAGAPAVPGPDRVRGKVFTDGPFNSAQLWHNTAQPRRTEMTDQKADIGFVITKPPLETGAVASTLKIAIEARKSGKSVGLFLISDGVWLAKAGQENEASALFGELIADGVPATASGDHLLAAGIPEDGLVGGVEVAKKPYKALVANVMEDWDKVMVI